MAELIHLVGETGADRSLCGINLTTEHQRANRKTADALIGARHLGADIPPVCIDCYTAGRPA